MSPSEIRSFREVSLMFLRIDERISELQKDVEESVSTKKQLIYVCLSTVIGPAVVAAVKYAFTSG